MKKIITKKTPSGKLIEDSTNKFIRKWLKKEFPFKELEQDIEITYNECNKLIATFAELIYSYKKISKDSTIKKDLYAVNNLCKHFTKRFYELINSNNIDTTIKAMISYTWAQVIKKYLKDAIKLFDFLGSQVALILLNNINVEVKKFV